MVHSGASARRPSRTTRLVPGVLAVLATLGLLGGLLTYWRVVAPGEPALAVPGVLAALLAITLVQTFRALLAADWLRRGAVLALPVGVLVTLLGVEPAAGCAVATADACRPTAPNPMLVGVGVLATLVPLYVDSRRRSVPREPDPIA